MKNNDRGFAVVYGLVVLLLASVVGTALLYMTQKDRTGATDYARMRDASQAAVAALKACEGQFQTQPDVMLAILRQFKANPNAKWMLGTAADATSEQKISLGSAADASKYSARIITYDSVNSFITIEGIGYVNNGGKKKVIASYTLAGLTIVTTIVNGSTMYLNGFSNLDHTLKIYGNVWAGGTSNVQPKNSGQLLIQDGNLKTGTGTFQMQGVLNITNGNAFFRGPAIFQNASSSFAGNVGFKSTLNLINAAINLTVTGNVYLKGDDLGAGFVNVSSGAYTAYYVTGLYDPAEINPTSPAVETGVAAGSFPDIPTALGMTDADQTAPTIVDDLATFITGKGGTVYASPSAAGINLDIDNWNLASAYTNASKWNGFLVVKVPEFTNFNRPITTAFTGKIIWIFDANGGTNSPLNPRTVSLSNWYSSAAGSNTLIYIRPKVQYFTDFGSNMPTAAPEFRGVIFHAGTATGSGGNYKFKGGTIIYGSIIHSTSLGPQFNSPGSVSSTVTLRYDAAIVNEFVNLQILNLTGGPWPIPALTLVDTKIRPTLLGMQL